MPKRKAPQEFEVHIEKDPKNPDAYKTAEWTKNKRHPYWESLFWCRKQIIEAEDQFILTGNTEYLRKAEIYNYNKRKLIYEGTSLITSKPPHKGIQSETFELKIWPPTPTRLDELLEECEKQDKEIEEINKKNKELIKKRIVKRRKISPPQSSDEIQIIDSPHNQHKDITSPRLTKHQKTVQSKRSPPKIETRKNLIDQQPLTQNQQQRYQTQEQPYQSIYPILKGNLLNIINNPEPLEPEITSHQPQLTQIEFDIHLENF